MEKKSLLLRLDQDLADRLQAVADIEERTVTDVVREAIAEHIDRRRADPAFQRSIKESVKRHRRLLELLAEDDS